MRGMDFSFIKSNKFKTITVGVAIRDTLTRQTATKNALLPHILKRGSQKYPNYESIVIKTEELYGAEFDINIIKKGEEQLLTFILELPEYRFTQEDILDEGISFLLEIMMKPLVHDNQFDNEIVAAAKKNLRQMIESKINDKKSFAVERCIEEAFSGEAFGISGDGYKEDLELITAQELYENHTRLISEGTFHFFAVGNFDEQKLKDNFIKRLEVCKTTHVTDKRLTPKASAHEINKIVESSDISQAKLCVCLTSGVQPGTDDYYTLLVTNSVMGGGTHSKLFQKMREKESLCYYVSSIVYRFKSVIIIQSGIDGEKVERATACIKEAAADMINSVSIDEIENSKRGLVYQFNAIGDSPRLMLDHYITGHLIGDNTTIKEAAVKIQKITRDDVVECAKGLNIHTLYLLDYQKEGEV